jgi:PhnB protein
MNAKRPGFHPRPAFAPLPHSNFGGNCEEAFRFYEKTGGKVLRRMRQEEAPGSSATGDAGKAFIHARLPIGDAILLGNDVPTSVFEKIRSVCLFLSLESCEEAERVCALLAWGGQVYMPMEETFFANRFAQLRDRFGVSWSMIHERSLAEENSASFYGAPRQSKGDAVGEGPRCVARRFGMRERSGLRPAERKALSPKPVSLTAAIQPRTAFSNSGRAMPFTSPIGGG